MNFESVDGFLGGNVMVQSTSGRGFTPEELAEMREMASKLGSRVGYDRRYRNLSSEEVKRREAEKRRDL